MSGEQLQQQNVNQPEDKEARMRDVLGRAVDKVDKLEKRLSELETENKSLRDEMDMMNVPDYSDTYEQNVSTAPPQIAQPPQQMGIFRDPRTGQLYQVPVIPQNQPVAPPPAQRQQPQMSKERVDQLNNTYNRICNDLEYHGKLHPDDAESLAADIMRKHERSGKSVESIQREMAKSNPVIKSVLKAQVEQLANLTGAKVTYEDAVEVNDHSQAQTPTSVPQTTTAAQPMPNSNGVVIDEVPPITPQRQQPVVQESLQTPAGLSTERNTVPPAIDSGKTAKNKYQTVSDMLDGAITG